MPDSSDLHLDVYVTPMRPMRGAAAGAGEVPENPVIPDLYQDWIASLDQIAALEPRVVVSGHERVGAADDPRTIGESQQYLRDFSRVVASEETVEGIVSAMLELHPDRDNPRVVWHCTREAVKKRQA